MSQEVVESKAPGASVLEEVLLALCSNKSAFSNNHFVSNITLIDYYQYLTKYFSFLGFPSAFRAWRSNDA